MIDTKTLTVKQDQILNQINKMSKQIETLTQVVKQMSETLKKKK